MKKCPNCKRNMTPLFFSNVCDYCDGLKELDAPHVGYVVWNEDGEDRAPLMSYVFSSPEHAKRWRELRGPTGGVIREVRSTHPFVWRTGVQSTADLEFADTLVQLYADQKYPPGHHRAFLT